MWASLIPRWLRNVVRMPLLMPPSSGLVVRAFPWDTNVNRCPLPERRLSSSHALRSRSWVHHLLHPSVERCFVSCPCCCHQACKPSCQATAVSASTTQESALESFSKSRPAWVLGRSVR
ncbi:hypothetical protein C5E06_11600 [Pseudoclavibacter sp. RFBI5]|nr:hypothetical protein C5E06_11600 [Pseudoclavibacter sp. RFBI5]